MGAAEEQLAVRWKLGDWNMHPAVATPERASVTVIVQVTFAEAAVVLMALGVKPKAVKAGSAVSHWARAGPPARQRKRTETTTNRPARRPGMHRSFSDTREVRRLLDSASR